MLQQLKKPTLTQAVMLTLTQLTETATSQLANIKWPKMLKLEALAATY